MGKGRLVICLMSQSRAAAGLRTGLRHTPDFAATHKKMINFLCIGHLVVKQQQILSLSLAIFDKEEEQSHESY